jgi:hypothetical protein
MGYRLGLTASLMDSTISVHFTPLKATIAYMPWTFNADNHIDYSFDRRIDANLVASSLESSIMVMTDDCDPGDPELHVKLDNIKIEDFLSMSMLAPPIKGSINSDMRVKIREASIIGDGTLSVKNLFYDRQRVGDFDMTFDAGLESDGDTKARASLLIDNKEAMTAYGVIHNDTTLQSPMNMGVRLTKFPLSVANAFLGADVASLRGALDGEMKMTGSMTNPLLNGNIVCDSVSVYIPMMGSSVKFDSEPIIVDNNVLRFNKFDLWGANGNPLTLDGIVDARNLNDINFDLTMGGSNFQLIGNDKKSKSDIYGKLFMDMDASVKGPMKHFDVNARVSILKNTDVYYTMSTAASQITQQSSDEVVKFVKFDDEYTPVKADSVSTSMNMRITAALTIASGTKATVNLSTNGSDKVELSPSGTLNYSQNFMGDMRLNGQLNLGNGYARYNIPVLGEKKFTFNPSSNVVWNGDIMNPTLNVTATDEVKANVSSSGNSRLVNFIVTLSVANTLSSPKVSFDLSTDDDLTVQNELQSMSADQRSNQAMNLLLYNQYTGSGTKTTNMSETALYSFLSSQLNSWAASNIRGVDLSFGIDQYDKTTNGDNSSTMSYSYQVSKSLFDNRFKIVVGGNYSTDASADENFAQNLISDISFEYMLRQTNNQSLYLKLFRHTGYETILEGEVTEMGVGCVMKRKLSNLRQLFRFKSRKKSATAKSSDADTVTNVSNQDANTKENQADVKKI